MRALNLLGELALRAALLGAAGAVAAWIVRRRGAEAQHVIWRIVLAGMLVLPILMAVLPPLPILAPRVVMTATANVVSVIGPSPRTKTPPSFDQGPFSVPVDSSPPSRQGILSLEWPVVVFGIYLAITALQLGRIALAIARAKRSAGLATRVSVGLFANLEYPRPEVRESACVSVPFTVGRLEPVVVLPANWREWDDFKLRSVLAHEMAHIRRADWSTSLAAAINRAVFWFHPLAWWLERRLATLAEDACDAIAIRSAGDAPRYARVVLEFAEVASVGQMAGANLMARPSRVGRRIRGILEGRVTLSQTIGGFAQILILLIALPAVYAAASLQLTGEGQATALTKSPLSRYSSMSRADASRAILSDGWNLTAAEAQTLESELVRDPENLSARIRLISYYTQYMIVPEQRATHLLWLVEHHPDSDVFQAGGVVTSVFSDWTGLNSPASSERARDLWLRQTDRFPTNTKVLANAATAFAGRDRIALEFVKRLRAIEPDNPEWLDWLGAIYATAVRSSFAGGYPRVRAGRSKSVHVGLSLPFAESDLIRRELESSADIALVGTVAQELLRETSLIKNRRFGADAEVQASETFGKQLLLRARQSDPDSPRWK